MNPYILFGLILFLICAFALLSMDKAAFMNYVAPYASVSHTQWWNRPGSEHYGYPSYTYWEGFENRKKEDSAILSYPPNSPSPTDVQNNQPYHLLDDMMQPPRVKESISCVNSRSCYATDFERMIEKTGTFRQLTNNYKRGYPDNCSAPFQELTLNFYKTDAIPIPENNTGRSVSEA